MAKRCVAFPVALYPATSESEKISFNQLNRQTDHRIKYLKSTLTPAKRCPTRTSSRAICSTG
jgi:DNA end-binding protein Ku